MNAEEFHSSLERLLIEPVGIVIVELEALAGLAGV